MDDSNTREHEGTGIGLALVKEMIDLHRGTVVVESEVGEGTTFIITLPKGKAHLKDHQITTPQEEAEAVLAEPYQDAMAELASADFEFIHANEHLPELERTDVTDASPLILVVDDNKDVREYVASILGQHYRIAQAADGQEGLERTRSLDPDLIISDVMMPRMDGNTMCRRIKEDPVLNHIPVILLTARATHELKLEGLEGGADDYMTKPFNAQELLVRVRNLLRLRHQQKELVHLTQELKHLNENLEREVEQQIETLLIERLRYEQELINARDQAEASSRLKSTILDNINHEFRTPLSAILSFTQIVKTELQGELQEFAEEIERGGDRLMKTLNAVIHLAEIESEPVDANAERLDLVQEARRALDPFREHASAKELGLHLKAPKDLPVPAFLDRKALRRILSSLLDNALKFTRQGEIILEVAQQNDQVMLGVHDTGIGIAPEVLPTIFDAFRQGDSGLTRAHEGLGLGLTIARQLTQRMGGTLTVESEPGRGSAFIVKFPTLRDEEVPSTPRDVLDKNWAG